MGAGNGNALVMTVVCVVRVDAVRVFQFPVVQLSMVLAVDSFDSPRIEPLVAFDDVGCSGLFLDLTGTTVSLGTFLLYLFVPVGLFMVLVTVNASIVDKLPAVSNIHELDLSWTNNLGDLGVFDDVKGPSDNDMLGHLLRESKTRVDAIVLEVDYTKTVRVEPVEERIGIDDETSKTELDNRKLIHGAAHADSARPGFLDGHFVEVLADSDAAFQFSAPIVSTGNGKQDISILPRTVDTTPVFVFFVRVALTSRPHGYRLQCEPPSHP